MASFDPRQFNREVLQANGINAVFGVPDSSLSGLLSYFSATKPASEHVVTANEGAAVALAAGYYLSTRKVALAYMQNSGLANALNPLQSVAAKEVFGIPMLLMIGWRGKPGEKDEPQHALIGPNLLENLKANDIPYEEIPDSLSGAKDAIARLVARAVQNNTPVAIIVPRNTFAEYSGPTEQLQESPPAIANGPINGYVKTNHLMSFAPDLQLSRELAIRHVLRYIKPTDVSVSSLGGNSRELYMIRREKGESIGRNFFCIGGMGHAFALAHGIAMGFSSGRVFCIDGDGSFLMHIGNNAILAGISDPNPNVIHVVIYNSVYSSTGSQPLMITRDGFLALADGLSYKQKLFVDNAEGLEKACETAKPGSLIVVVVNDEVQKSLPRPSETSQELKDLFIESFA